MYRNEWKKRLHRQKVSGKEAKKQALKDITNDVKEGKDYSRNYSIVEYLVLQIPNYKEEIINI